MRSGEMHKSNIPSVKGVAGVASVNTRAGVVTLVPSDVGITAAVDKGVVYMDGTSYANSAAFTWDKTTHTLTLGGGVDGTLTLGATPFVFKESSPGNLSIVGPNSNLFSLNTSAGGLNPQAVFDFNTGSTLGIAFGSAGSPQLVSSGQIDIIGTATGPVNPTITIATSGSDEIDNTLGSGLGTYLLGTSLQPQADGQLDLGQVTTPRRWRTGYFGTSVVSPLITATTGNFSGTVTAAAFVTASLQAAFVASPYGAAAGNTGEYRFLELAANGTDYVALKAPDALAAPLTFTLPAVDHAGPISSNGSGVLSAVAGQDLTIVIPVANKTLTFTKGVLTGVV